MLGDDILAGKYPRLYLNSQQKKYVIGGCGFLGGWEMGEGIYLEGLV